MNRKDRTLHALDEALAHYITKINSNKRQEYKVPMPLVRKLHEKLRNEWWRYNPSLGMPAGSTSVYKWYLYELKRNCFTYCTYQLPQLTRSMWGSILTLQGKLDRRKLIKLYADTVRTKHPIEDGLVLMYEHDVSTLQCGEVLGIPIDTLKKHRAGLVRYVELNYGLPLPAHDDVVIGWEDIANLHEGN